MSVLMKSKYWLALVLFAVGACGTGCCILPGNRVTADDVFRRETLSYPYELGGWHLFLGAEGVLGDPVEAFTHVYGERNGKVVRIDRPCDVRSLSGVEIKTPDEALAMVRLFTSRDTYFYFRSPVAVEYPDNHAVVEQGKAGFSVKRHLLYLDGGYRVYEVEEVVSQNAGYRCRKIKLIETLTRLPSEIRFHQ